MCGVRPSSTYSRTRIPGGSSGACGTYASRRATSRRPSRETSSPPSATEPSYGTSPATARSSVLLPAPFGPISATHSPRRDLGVTSSTTRVRPSSTDTPSSAEAHVNPLLVRSRIAKNGAPKNAVTTPIGSSAGDISVRASTSASTRKPPPKSSDSGSTIR